MDKAQPGPGKEAVYGAAFDLCTRRVSQVQGNRGWTVPERRKSIHKGPEGGGRSSASFQKPRRSVCSWTRGRWGKKWKPGPCRTMCSAINTLRCFLRTMVPRGSKACKQGSNMIKSHVLKAILATCEDWIGGGEEWVWLRGYLSLLHRKDWWWRQPRENL